MEHFISIAALIVSVLALYAQYFSRRRRLTVSVSAWEPNPVVLRLSVGLANAGAESLLIEKLFLSIRTPSGGCWPAGERLLQPDKTEPSLPIIVCPHSVCGVKVESTPFSKGMFSNLSHEGDGITPKNIKLTALLRMQVLTSRGKTFRRQMEILEIGYAGTEMHSWKPLTSRAEFFSIRAIPTEGLPAAAEWSAKWHTDGGAH